MSKKKDSLKPWLSRPAVNRSVTLPLTRPLTQRLSNLNEFHPNELDPYLLFDARDSMVGTLENPTLDLDPSKPDTLNVITATRSGTATYTDANGNIATAAADTVRVDHVDGVPMILVEPSAINLVEYSEDFSDSSWDKQSGGTGVDPVVTPNSAISPDGTQNASKVVFNTAGGTTTSDESFLTARLPTVIGGTYTQSVYLKGDVGGEQILIRGAGGSAYTTITLTTDWVRYEGTEVEPNNTDAYLQIGLRQGLSGVVINQSTTVYIWGAQFEEGSVATSYIPTSGGDAAARTRQADDLVISGSDFSDFFNGSEGTFYIEAVDRQATGSSHAYLAGQSTSQFFIYKNAGSTQIYNLDGTNILDLGQVVSNQLFRAAVTYKTGVSPAPSVISLSFNGTSEVDQPYSESFAATNILKIGSGYAKVFSGHFRRILFWPYHSDRL